MPRSIVQMRTPFFFFKAGGQSHQIQRGPDYKLGSESPHGQNETVSGDFSQGLIQHRMKNSSVTFCRMTSATSEGARQTCLTLRNERPGKSGEGLGKEGSYFCIILKQSLVLGAYPLHPAYCREMLYSRHKGHPIRKALELKIHAGHSCP